jgi:SAM-dependent methyltransferase
MVSAVTTADALTERTQAIWNSGDFGRIASGFAAGAAAFVARLALVPGERVLDVACGTGNLAIPAAATGACVAGIDISPNLIEAAREAGRVAALNIHFEVGNAEALPYTKDACDTVISMFGVMFAARPERALSELLRVTRPGGRIVLANWTPRGFVGSMLRAHTALVPPPPGAPSVLEWGDESATWRRLEPHSARLDDVRFVPRTIGFDYALTPGGVVELFRDCYGPSVCAFAALDPAGRAALSAELLGLWDSHNTAGPGATHVDAEYVEIQIDVR